MKSEHILLSIMAILVLEMSEYFTFLNGVNLRTVKYMKLKDKVIVAGTGV